MKGRTVRKQFRDIDTGVMVWHTGKVVQPVTVRQVRRRREETERTFIYFICERRLETEDKERDQRQRQRKRSETETETETETKRAHQTSRRVCMGVS